MEETREDILKEILASLREGQWELSGQAVELFQSGRYHQAIGYREASKALGRYLEGLSQKIQGENF